MCGTTNGSFATVDCQNHCLYGAFAAVHSLGSLHNSLELTMHRYVIERNIPGVGTFDGRQLQQAAATSNAALAELAGKVQWVESYVVDDKTFCIYLAENEAAVHQHARISGFPASKVTPVRAVIDPMTAAA